MAHCKGFHTFCAVDTRFGVQAAQPGRTQVAERDRAGEGRPPGLMGSGTQQVIKDQRADSTMDVAWRSLIRGAEIEFGAERVRGVRHDEWGSDGVAQPDRSIAPGDCPAIEGRLHSERTGDQSGAEELRRLVDQSPCGTDGLCVDLAADRHVDEPANRVGQWAVQRPAELRVDRRGGIAHRVAVPAMSNAAKWLNNIEAPMGFPPPG